MLPRRSATLVFAACAAALLLLPGGAAAEHPGGAPGPAPLLPSERLVLDLVDWIDANTGFDVSKTRKAPPAVEFHIPGETIDYEGRDIVIDPRIRGAYDADRQVVILVPPWSEDDDQAVSTLLHELIHHVQLQSREWDCIGQPEWQAYKLQEKWLNERGETGGFDWLDIFIRSRCPMAVKPE